MSYVPIKDAKVTIRNESLVKIAEGYTNENGIVTFTFPKGRYNISVEKEGYQKHEQWIDLLDNLTKEVVLMKTVPPVTEPSGIDPNDPTWCPPEGWTKVWKFLTEDELEDFADRDYEYAYVVDSLLKFNPPKDTTGYASRYKGGTYLKRIAICSKINVFSCEVTSPIIYVRIYDGSSAYILNIRQVEYDVTKLQLYDWVYEIYKKFNNPNDWIVFVFNHETRKARVYDRNKNILAELTVQPAWIQQINYEIYLNEDDFSYLRYEHEVDWVAIQEAQ